MKEERMKPHEIRQLARETIAESPSYLKGKRFRAKNVDEPPEIDEPAEGEAEPGHPQFESMTIRSADNGFSVETRSRAKNGKDGVVVMEDGKTHVFKSIDEVADHILGRKRKDA